MGGIAMRFSAFSGAFIDYSIQQSMQIVKAIGFEGIEIACREPHLSPETSLLRVEEIRSVAEGLDLAIPALAGYGGGFSTASDHDSELAFADFQRLLDIACRLNVPMIRVQPGGPNAFMAQPYHFSKAAYWLERCAKEALLVDKRVVLEIHNQSLVETVESSLHLLGKIDSPNIGMIHDAGNMFITGTDYGHNSIAELGNSLFHVHVKDIGRIDQAGVPGTFINLTSRGEEAFRHCRLGDGETDHRSLFNSLQGVGYNGWVTLESNAPYPPEQRLAHDLRTIKSYLIT
jgi:L-ribulose-5-phosphate 3-epimerase